MAETIRPFTRELRKQGFVLEHRDSHCTTFEMDKGNRRLSVQLWSDGSHRVSHGTLSKFPGGGASCRKTTHPTSFSTVPEMLRAVAMEWTRPSTVPPGESESIARLAEAVRVTERDHPLPRCRHGKCLRDGAGEALQPSCGCCR